MITINELFSGIGSQVAALRRIGVPYNVVGIAEIDKHAIQSYKFPDKTELLFRLKDLLEPAADEKYYLKGEKIERLLNNFTGLKTRECCDMSVNEPEIKTVANCILARYDNGVSNHKSVGTAVIEPFAVIGSTQKNAYHGNGEMCCTLTSAMGSGGGHIPMLVEPKIQMVGLLDIKGNEQVRRVYNEDGLAPTLNTMQGGNRQPKILQHPHGFNKGNVFENCPTITANGSFEQNNFLLHNLQIRKLTPLECWRLMGFTDEDFYKARGKFLKTKTLPEYDEDDEGERIVVGFKERKVYEMSDNQLYKQAGNSIVVNVLAFIFRNLFNAPTN